MLPPHVADRFLSKVLWPSSLTACWPWGGTVNSDGYGRFRIGTRYPVAHRVAYQLFRGSIPEDLELDHLCRVRHCVNPVHLEAVVGAVNLRRAPTQITTVNAGKTHCLHGHEFTEDNTYLDRRGARHCRSCRSNRSRGGYRERVKRGYRAPLPESGKTCGAGHLYTTETTYVAPNGGVQCRTCRRLRNRKYEAVKRAAGVAA